LKGVAHLRPFDDNHRHMDAVGSVLAKFLTSIESMRNWLLPISMIMPGLI
jgi:hypothetical protein